MVAAIAGIAEQTAKTAAAVRAAVAFFTMFILIPLYVSMFEFTP